MQSAFFLLRLLGMVPVSIRSPRMGAAMLLGTALLLPFGQLGGLLETLSRATRSMHVGAAAPSFARPDSAGDDRASDTPQGCACSVHFVGAEPPFVAPSLASLGAVERAESATPQPRFIRGELQRGPPSAFRAPSPIP
jgi:hypothetical protein